MFTELLFGLSTSLGISGHILFSWSHILGGEAKPSSKYIGKMISCRELRAELKQDGVMGTACCFHSELTTGLGGPGQTLRLSISGRGNSIGEGTEMRMYQKS